MATITIGEIIRYTGLSPGIFNLSNEKAFEPIIEEQLALARVTVRRAVGSANYSSADADVQTQIKMALMNQVAAGILLAVLTQRATGTGPPLVMWPKRDLEEVIQGLSQRAVDLMNDIQTPSPTDEAPNLATSYVESQDPVFKMSDVW